MKNNFMKNRIKYAIAIISVFLVSAIGSLITNKGMDWYDTINLPSFTPPGSFIGMVWTIIFILATFSVLFFLRKNKENREIRFQPILIFLIINGILNIFWSTLFFGWGLIFWSIIEMIVLNITTLILIILLWRNNKFSSVLLWPYFLWVSFATYLAYNIWLLN
jgi:tryptophan-rich sensory protein